MIMCIVLLFCSFATHCLHIRQSVSTCLPSKIVSVLKKSDAVMVSDPVQIRVLICEAMELMVLHQIDQLSVWYEKLFSDEM